MCASYFKYRQWGFISIRMFCFVGFFYNRKPFFISRKENYMNIIKYSLGFYYSRHKNSHMIQRQLGNTFYYVEIETCVHHIYFFLAYSLDVDPHRNSLMNCEVLEINCVCVYTSIYIHTCIFLYTESPLSISYLLLCKITTLLPQQYLCSLKP